MKDQVLMSPNNGQLCVGIPLFRWFHETSNATYPITIGWNDTNPLAYVLDCGAFAQVLSAEWVEDNLINLGDL
jgi:hypothetical protein